MTAYQEWATVFVFLLFLIIGIVVGLANGIAIGYDQKEKQIKQQESKQNESPPRI